MWVRKPSGVETGRRVLVILRLMDSYSVIEVATSLGAARSSVYR